MNKTWKIVIAGSAVALAMVSVVMLSFAMLSNPIFAASPTHFGMNHYIHGGPWRSGFGQQQWQGMPYSVANSTGNWTGSVSINSINTQTIDAIKDKVKVSATDAAIAAEKSLGNGSRINAISITPVRGYLVYTILGIDRSNNIHTLFVDVGNGNILTDQQIGHSNALFIVDGPWGQWHQGGGWAKGWRSQ